MDIQPVEKKGQTLSDDQELAKVLAGVNVDAPDDDTTATADPAVPPVPPPADDAAADADNDADVAEATDEAAQLAQASEDLSASMPPMPPAANDDLESIKLEALGELRPLVDKLDVSPEEKFDTYLLLLRSTDDRDLISPAYESAKAITDEARRAQALLDIIKEINYLTNPQQPAT